MLTESLVTVTLIEIIDVTVKLTDLFIGHGHSQPATTHSLSWPSAPFSLLRSVRRCWSSHADSQQDRLQFPLFIDNDDDNNDNNVTLTASKTDFSFCYSLMMMIIIIIMSR